MKGFIHQLLAFTAMGILDTPTQGSTRKQPVRLEDINGDLPIQSKPPKGCKEYWFNKNGGFYDGENGHPMRRDESVFYCHASNEKNARKKFKVWEESQK